MIEWPHSVQNQGMRRLTPALALCAIGCIDLPADVVASDAGVDAQPRADATVAIDWAGFHLPSGPELRATCDGPVGLEPPPSLGPMPWIYAAATGDFDCDGQLDLLVATPPSDTCTSGLRMVPRGPTGHDLAFGYCIEFPLPAPQTHIYALTVAEFWVGTGPGLDIATIIGPANVMAGGWSLAVMHFSPIADGWEMAVKHGAESGLTARFEQGAVALDVQAVDGIAHFFLGGQAGGGIYVDPQDEPFFTESIGQPIGPWPVATLLAHGGALGGLMIGPDGTTGWLEDGRVSPLPFQARGQPRRGRLGGTDGIWFATPDGIGFIGPDQTFATAVLDTAIDVLTPRPGDGVDEIAWASSDAVGVLTVSGRNGAQLVLDGDRRIEHRSRSLAIDWDVDTLVLVTIGGVERVTLP